ncbi:MAG: hypothetical protein NTY10_04995 [Candidatus Omnitrophica bacterium]|nr:hypothetical protein [Candidatus Omnitrophota bacterium]
MGTENIFMPATEMLQKLWGGLSTLILALIVFLLGWLIAKILCFLITRLFKEIKIDKLVEDSGFKGLLEKGNITKPVSELLGIAVYWIMLLVVVFIALMVGNISIPPIVIGQLLEFIPRFVLGIIIFILSLFLGRFFKGVVQTSVANAGIDNPGFLAKVAESGIVIFGTVLALQIIGIATSFISSTFNIILAAFCFGAALAFALGSKDLIKGWLEGYFQKSKK